MKKLYERMFDVGAILVLSCSILLFIGFCLGDSGIQLDSSYNWIVGLWTISFVFGVLLVLISAPNIEIK